jgi:hypothetical protein
VCPGDDPRRWLGLFEETITVCGYAALTAMAARPEQIADMLIAVVLDGLCRTPSSSARRPADGTH